MIIDNSDKNNNNDASGSINVEKEYTKGLWFLKLILRKLVDVTVWQVRGECNLKYFVKIK